MFQPARRGYALAVVLRHIYPRSTRGLKRTLNTQKLFHTRRPAAMKAARHIAQQHDDVVDHVLISRVAREPFATVFANDEVTY